ncbi:MAG: SRPBCC domain-containing protein [Spirochaetales bacterium]|nr:SRPBCC domain-containing protein [Spirochaetales bacterium]
MAKTFKQAARCTASPTKLYRSFLDEQVISDLAGLKTAVAVDENGGKIVFGDAKAQVVVNTKNKMIVMDLKTPSWPKGAQNALVTVAFSKEEDTALIEVFSSNVPDENADELKAIWKSVLSAVKKAAV